MRLRLCQVELPDRESILPPPPDTVRQKTLFTRMMHPHGQVGQVNRGEGRVALSSLMPAV